MPQPSCEQGPIKNSSVSWYPHASLHFASANVCLGHTSPSNHDLLYVADGLLALGAGTCVPRSANHGDLGCVGSCQLQRVLCDNKLAQHTPPKNFEPTHVPLHRGSVSTFGSLVIAANNCNDSFCCFRSACLSQSLSCCSSLGSTTAFLLSMFSDLCAKDTAQRFPR